MNRAMVSRLAEHMVTELVEVHEHDYNEAQSIVRHVFYTSWRAPYDH